MQIEMNGSKQGKAASLRSRDKAIDETLQPDHPSSQAKLFLSHRLSFTLSEEPPSGRRTAEVTAK
jgi:hypothetical protein